MVIVDTSIFIDHFRQKSNDDTLLLKMIREIPTESFACSLISIQELYEGKSTRKHNEEVAILEMLNKFELLPYTFPIAQLAGIIARDTVQKVEIADAAIAATAILNDAQLFTLNKKDFAKIPNLKLYEIDKDHD